jgi:hypothetical protein
MPATLPEIVAPVAEVGAAGAAELDGVAGDAGEWFPHVVVQNATPQISARVLSLTVLPPTV